MIVSVRSCLMAGVAVVTASALVVAPSVRPPAPALVASPSIQLSAAVQPLTPPDNIPSLADEMQLVVVPSLGSSFPQPPIPGPSPAPTGFEDAIKNTYTVIEPWVRYGFELAAWGVSWIPWVGWLAPQINIFYNFGERIVRSLVFNSADWLWGPLPFLEGVGNIAEDSWNALVQLGRDQWNFWGFPPLPGAAGQTTTAAANLAIAPRQPGQTAHVLQSLRERLGLQPPRERLGLQSLREGLGLPDLSARDTAEPAATNKESSGVTSAADLYPANIARLKTVLQAPRKAADALVAARGELHAAVTKFNDAAADAKATRAAHSGGTALRRSPGPSATASARWSAAQRRPGGALTKAHQFVRDSARKEFKHNNDAGQS